MINTVTLPGTDLSTSVLGMGCASLGSRIARTQGLRALAAAHDQGVTWFDVAPAYGAGEAEPILGEFARGRRDRMLICSKVGVVPPRHNGAIRAVYALGRPLLGSMAGLRGRFRKVKATRNVALALSPAFIIGSLETTLRRIGSDHVDVFALHKVSVEDLGRGEVLRALEDIVRAGKARYIAVASSEAAAMAALDTPDLYRVLQLADNPTTCPLPKLLARATNVPAFVTHSVFGVDGAKDRFVARLRAEPAARKHLEEAGYDGSNEQVIAELLLDRALSSNAKGVVITSMFADSHLASNVARASQKIRPDAIEIVERLIGENFTIESVV